MTNPPLITVLLKDDSSRGEFGKQRGNGARPRPTLEILWTNSNVLRILGGPGRNLPGARMSDSVTFLQQYKVVMMHIYHDFQLKLYALENLP